MNSIKYTIENEMCTGCGVCEDVCAKNAISIMRIGAFNQPVLDEKACVNCSRCLKVCPGVGGKLIESNKNLFEQSEKASDSYVGRYSALYTGYSTNHETRFHAASGGMLSQFLVFLLEKHVIDGAVVTALSQEDHLTPVSYIARTKEEILNAKSTKYCPVALNKVGNEICKSEGKYVVVGIPCHIQGFRKRAAIDKKFNERVIGYFSIFCSSIRSFYSQEYLLEHYGKCNAADVEYFSYRDNGCLGDMVIRKKNGEETSIPYIHYYGRLRSFFKPHRCSLCVDHYGMLADVSFGDIHIEPYSDDKIGVNSCIARNAFFDDLLKQAFNEGYLHIDPLDPKVLNESQKVMLYPKKRRVRAQMNWDKLFGYKIPEYDVVLDKKPGIKDYITIVVAKMQAFVGRHRSLWFLIDLSNKGRK